MNDFGDDLAWSHAQSDQPWWEEVYRAAFPEFIGMQAIPQDGWAQRGGIDRLVTLRCGTVLRIDEKARRQVWPDILLEFWSDEERRIPGWIAKGLACDFLAYAFVPIRTCYLLPFQTLRRAWYEHRYDWIKQYGTKRASNARYTTASVAVPTQVLLDSLADAMTCTWTATEAPIAVTADGEFDDPPF
jgi:hypothetical protein